MEDNSASTRKGTRGLATHLSFEKRVRADRPMARVWRRFCRHKLGLISLGVLGLIVSFAVFAEVLASHDPYLINLQHTRQGPDRAHLLGTDLYGRDVLSRLIYGGRVSLTVGLVAVSIYEAIAIVLGSISGYRGGVVDIVIMRAVDMVLCFPWLIIILIFIAFFGPSIYNIMLGIGLLGWPGPTRLVRGQFLSLRESLYVTAARCVGVPDRGIMFRHILPGVVAPLIVHATFGVALAILTEAALSFLGLGVRPPVASWGNMLTDAQSLTILARMPWLWLPPGLAIMVTVLAINFVGDALHDALDPRALNK